ncbi:MAG: hypothetical protein RIB59_03660 [Rhodospirillales bacterium]
MRSKTVAAVLAAVLSSAPAGAADFTGKQVNVLVPGAAKSALHAYVNFVMPFIARHLPGKPAAAARIEKDAVEDAKALRTANPDGLTVLALSGPDIMAHLLAKPIAKQRIGTFIPVLLSPKGITVRIDPALGIEMPKEIEKLKGLPATYAGDNPKSVDLRTTFMFELLGVSLKPLWLGTERHDYKPNGVTIFSDAAGAVMRTEKPKAEPLPVWTGGALLPGGTMGRDPARPDLPHFLEAYKTVNGLELSGGPRRAFETLFHATLAAARGLFLAPGTPQSIRDSYRAAVQNMFGDPEFRKDLRQNLGPYPQLFGDAAGEAFRKAAAPDRDTREWIQNYSRMHGGKI